MFRAGIVVLAMMGFGASAMAQDAGCGLGSMIIQKNSKLLQLFAATTNGSFGSQTFGITFGTSGCKASSIVSRDQAVDHFVAVNDSTLRSEIARGEGESLGTVASLAGCSSQEVAPFAVKAKDAFAQSPSSETQMIVRQVRSDLASSGMCKGT